MSILSARRIMRTPVCGYCTVTLIMFSGGDDSDNERYKTVRAIENCLCNR